MKQHQLACLLALQKLKVSSRECRAAKLASLEIEFGPVNSKLDWNDILAAIFEAK